MAEVASRELRNNTRGLLNRVEAGEAITITIDGRPVAVLQPVGRRPRWLTKSRLLVGVHHELTLLDARETAPSALA